MATFGVWMGAFFTLAIFSFLYGENAAYRFSEHLFLGLAAAHLMVQGYQNIINRAWTPLTQKGEIIWLGAILGGLMLLTRWFKPVAWISRMPLGFMMGVAAALSVKRAIQSEFWRQVASTSGMSLDSANNVMFVLTVILVLSYFIFGVSEKSGISSILRPMGMVGQYLMMIAFGASLGSTVMARLSLVIARLQFLFVDWLKIL